MLKPNEKDYMNLLQVLSIFQETDGDYQTCLVKAFRLQAEKEGAYALSNRLLEDSYCCALIRDLKYLDLSNISALVHALEIIKIMLCSSQNTNGGNI